MRNMIIKSTVRRTACVLTACAVCALTFGSCAKHSGPAAKTLDSSGAESVFTESSGAESSGAPVSSAIPAVSKPAASIGPSAVLKAAASSCGGAGLISVNRAVDTQPIVKGEPSRAVGPAQFPYDRCNHAYYHDIGKVDSIQNNIESGLCGNFYKIKGVDPAKSIAAFTGHYYDQLDYVFPDSVTYNGENYLINANNSMPDDGSLGQADGYNLYRLKDFDPSMELGVELIPGRVSAAFRLESIVTLNGTPYEVEPSLSKISKGEKLKALGKAHGETAAYDAYSAYGVNNDGTIILHVNKTYETWANPIFSTAGKPIPQSNPDTPFESMFAVGAMVQWPGHGFYYSDPQSQDQKYNSTAAQAAIKNQLGAFLGNYQPDQDSSYPMYVIKGINPAKKIMIQNNQVYLVYDYIFPDTLTYKGHTYRAGGVDGKEDCSIQTIRGGAIGMAGPYKVYAIKKIDPSKAIIIVMKGSAANVVSLATTITFFRIQ